MLFYSQQDNTQKKIYKEYLQIVGRLSKLFSNSNTPYLYYRIAEKIFSKAFFADDLSRADVSYDVVKNFQGIGLKTFLRNNNSTFQKIAEFNKDIGQYKDLKEIEKIKVIAHLRNKRLELTNNLYNINDSLYHCVVRDKNRFFFFEEEIKPIDINHIKIVKIKDSSILFEDGQYEYSFSLSKSTLLKRFFTETFLDEVEIDILEEPLNDLYTLMSSKNLLKTPQYLDTVYLPLYGSNQKIYSNSGLNQWNAKGRVRDKNEIYIPIPKKFYEHKPDFFPNKDIIFTLILPNKKIIQAKICQENSKALMSNPNKDLGQWLLRDVFKLNEGTLVTNDLLDMYGIDSLRIDKLNENKFEINFAQKGSFEKFMNDFE